MPNKVGKENPEAIWFLSGGCVGMYMYWAGTWSKREWLVKERNIYREEDLLTYIAFEKKEMRCSGLFLAVMSAVAGRYFRDLPIAKQASACILPSVFCMLHYALCINPKLRSYDFYNPNRILSLAPFLWM